MHRKVGFYLSAFRVQRMLNVRCTIAGGLWHAYW